MLIVLQKMVKDDGQVSPEFADAEEGDIHFHTDKLLLWLICKCVISLTRSLLQKNYTSFLTFS